MGLSETGIHLGPVGPIHLLGQLCSFGIKSKKTPTEKDFLTEETRNWDWNEHLAVT